MPQYPWWCPLTQPAGMLYGAGGIACWASNASCLRGVTLTPKAARIPKPRRASPRQARGHRRGAGPNRCTACVQDYNECITGAAGAVAGHNWLCPYDIPAGAAITGGGLLCYSDPDSCTSGPNACSSQHPCSQDATVCSTGGASAGAGASGWTTSLSAQRITNSYSLEITGSLASTVQLARQLHFELWKYDEHVMHDSRVVVFDGQGLLSHEFGPDTDNWSAAL